MATFKCKMCGGQLEIAEGTSICTCEYCGTEQTLPKVMDENLQSLFNRANALRMKAEFDKAAEIYEKILQASGTEAEAYWGLILCKYGIEYVEDPATYKRVPTCHRASYDAVTADDDYKMAIQYADAMQRSVYEAEAKAIDEIQKGILSLAQKESPYDVFICYKESDESGKRTVDSVIANDIYHQLTQEGFKVFYAAITLEDKLGQEYEPYIFAALNSARVMLSIGTKPEYFNAVWVKNEWSRFLKIMKKDRARMLIPCYKDMDAYELPEEFAHFQAQDMSKIGFINDIVRGIKKVIVKDEAKPEVQQVVVQQSVPVNSGNQAILKRGYIALEDGEWKKADGFFEEALNQDAECADAYMGKLLVQCRCSNISKLANYYANKYSKSTYETLVACDSADEHIGSIVEQYSIEDYLSKNDITNQYEFDRTYESELASRKVLKDSAVSDISKDRLFVRAMQYANGELNDEYANVVNTIKSIMDERINKAISDDNENVNNIIKAYGEHLASADSKVKEMYDKALEERESHYQGLIREFDRNVNAEQNDPDYADLINKFGDIKKKFQGIHKYKESSKYIHNCDSEILILKKKQEEAEAKILAKEAAEAAEKAKKEKRELILVVCATVVIVAAIILINKVVIPNMKYKKAESYLNNTDYDKAIEIYRDIDGYKDVKEKIVECEKNILQEAQVGDEIYFGNYKDNGKWIVLERKDNRILILGKYCIGEKVYNNENVDITWEKCSLRKWLNNEYYNKTFSDNEKAMIAKTKVINKDNPEYGTAGGNDTEDKVFLLSIDEVEKYFKNDSDRVALYNGDSCWWWLRSPGDNRISAASVYDDGSVCEYGYLVYSEYGVRPALWISIE